MLRNATGKKTCSVMGRSVSSTDPVLDRLREIGRELADLKEAVKIYEGILPLLRDADIHVAPVCLTPEQARRKMEEGLPLLHGLELEVDLEGTKELMLQLARLLEDCRKSSAARQIRIEIEEDRIDLGSILLHTAAGDNDLVTSVSEDFCLDAGLLRAITENALRPAFYAWRRQVTSLSEGSHWDRGECFVCGAKPIFGELRDNNLDKHLRCGRCGADWRFSRLQCLSCGNEDHRMLSFLYSSDPREKSRLEVCEECKGYLKVITTFSPTPPELLHAEDLATIHLDYAAQKRGYVRGGIYGSEARPEIA